MLTSFTPDRIGELTGARAQGTIPLTEHLINSAIREFLLSREPRLQQLNVTIQDGNRFEVLCKVDLWWIPPLKVEVIVDRVIANPSSPVVTIRPASWWGRVALTFVEQLGNIWTTLPSYLYVQDGKVHFAIAAFPQAGAFRSIFQYLKSVHLITRTGTLFVTFSWAVD
jgi:hypothetical protein